MSRSSPDTTRLFRMPLRTQQDVVLCRQRARIIVEMLGAETAEQVRIATAVSEIARNAVEYATGGTAEFHLDLAGNTLVAVIADKGPGIAQLAEILAGTYQSPSGLGRGILGARRLMDRMEIETAASGSRVRLERRLRLYPGRELSPADIQRIMDKLAGIRAGDANDELVLQSREFTRLLEEAQLRNDELASRSEELSQLASELRETNRGVLALYDELDTLHSLSRVISAQLDLETLAGAIITATTELFAAEIGAFLHSPNTEKRFRAISTAGELHDLADTIRLASMEELFGAEEWPNEVLRINSVEEAGGSVPAVVRSCHLRSYLAVPVFGSGNSMVGVLAFGHRNANHFSERHERILGAAASQAAIGMENARLYMSVQNASAAKDHFLATLSHELRTPLNPIFIIISEWEKDPRFSPEMRKDLELVQRNLHLEARLIDDLLDMTRIVQGKIYLHMQPVDVHDVVRAAFDTCFPPGSERRNRTRLELHASKHVVNGDATRLQQVLWNLLNNATKFTPSNGTISVSTADASREGFICIRVTDTGRGIEGPHLERIFSAFDQGEVAGVPEFGGLGLGLAISKYIVDAHGGQIFAASAGRDRGATFTVDLPLAREAAMNLAGRDAGAPAAHQAPKPLRVLLVDDHPDTLSVLGRVLTRRGHHVLCATDGKKAIEIANSNPLDVLISDIGLPDQSGLELMRELHERHGLKGIALSGYGAESDVTRSHEAGFIAHVTKPIDFVELEELLAKVARETDK